MSADKAAVQQLGEEKKGFRVCDTGVLEELGERFGQSLYMRRRRPSVVHDVYLMKGMSVANENRPRGARVTVKSTTVGMMRHRRTGCRESRDQKKALGQELELELSEALGGVEKEFRYFVTRQLPYWSCR